MKETLLTWYGITDFKASLAFDSSTGPVLGALKAEAYDEVVILGYTKPGEESTWDASNSQREFAVELAAIRQNGQEKDKELTNAFISKFANTIAAHEYFCAWLKEKLEQFQCITNVNFQNAKLRALNDTESIYAYANKALELVAKQQDKKRITLYLSPGTPVMAFVWAFAALNHPELEKRLIASPVIDQKPESIALPKEWLERHGLRQESLRGENVDFDVVLHLFGEQRMPSLLGVRQFKSKHHVFVNSKEYPVNCMRQFVENGKISKLSIDPWDASAVYQEILRYAEKLPEKSCIGVNLTGGTKLMFAGALSAARALGAVPFYFDIKNRHVTFLDGFYREPIKPIDSIETYLLLNGDGLEMNKDSADGRSVLAQALRNNRVNLVVNAALEGRRRSLTCLLWENRKQVANLYTKLASDNDKFKPFKEQIKNITFELNSRKQVSVTGSNLDLHFDDWPDFAKYLSGGWFEEYIYLLCKPYEDVGIIQDLRISVRLKLKQGDTLPKVNWGGEYNELDVVFTDGYSLYIVECKAGKVTQEQIMKLQNLVRFYGGVAGRGVVACCFPPNAESVKKKIRDAKAKLWQGEDIATQIQTLMNEIEERAKITTVNV